MRLRSVTVLTVVLCAVSFLPVAAQERQVGAKAGLSVATTTAEWGDGDKSRIAPAAGGFIVFPLAPRAAIQLEALYNSKGAILGDDGFGNEEKLLLDYIDVPVLLRIDLPRRGRTGVHLFGGPYAGLRVSAQRELSVSGTGTAGILEDVSDAITRFDTGIVAGAGVDIGRRLVVDGRYSWGLSNVNDIEGAVELKHRVLTVMAGIRF